jgi:DHA3 family macrolide efflux protein-like MFS transporter
MSHSQQGEPRATRWQVPFFTVWTGQQLSLTGSMLAGFALVWWLTRSTGSATVLATASLVQTLPRVLLGPFAGALVDRWNRRMVMLFADSVIALSTALLAYLFWTGGLEVWHVYVAMAIGAIGGTFHWPAMSASTSLMVPKEHLARVAGINQATHGVLNIVSPPLGALLITVLPLHGVMAVDVVTAAFAIIPLFFVPIPQPERRAVAAGAARPTLWADMREGFGFVWGWAGLRQVMFIAVVLNFLLNPASSLVPLLVTEHFAQGAPGLALLQSLWGGGVVLGGVLLSVWGGFRRRMLTSMLGVMGIGAGALLLGLAPAAAFWMALAGMALLGIMNPIANGPLHAIFQSVIPPDMQGRAFTMIGTACSAMAPVGMAIAGPVADALGIQSWFLVGGAACVVMAVYGMLSPVLMGIEGNHRAQQEAASSVVAGVQADVSA